MLSQISDASYLNHNSVMSLNYQKNLRFLKFKTKMKKKNEKKKIEKKRTLLKTFCLYYENEDHENELDYSLDEECVTFFLC